MAPSDKILEHQPEIESEPIIEPEKESFVVEEERQVLDELEKDLQLSIETEDFDEMSQLNPDAKEFVPVSPTRSNGPMSPPLNGEMNAVNPLLSTFADDALVSQSPRKGESPMMDDIYVPTEKDFDIEAEQRPHEINQFVENGGFQRVESPDVLNLKESLQEDDKLEQGYKDEAQAFFEDEKPIAEEDYKVLESSFNEYSNGFQNVIDDPMHRSFYEGRDDGDILIDAPRNPDVLNSVQPIPAFEDEQPEADHQEIAAEKEAPEADWNIDNELKKPIVDIAQQATNLLDVEPAPTMETSFDNFEAERFVEEIKSANVEFDKYIDQELSPTLPEFLPSSMQAVEETVVVENPIKQVVDLFVTESAPVEVPQVEEAPLEFQKVPEVSEPPPTPATDFEEQQSKNPEPEKIIEKLEQEAKVELGQVAGGAAVVAAAAVVGVVAATKKKPTSAGNKTDVKPKAPVASKVTAAPIKKPTSAGAASKPAPISKLSSASMSAAPKPLAAKKLPATTTAKPAPKPAVSSAPISRPKPTTTTVPPVKKPAGTISKTASETTAKPTPATRTTTLTKKTTSVATTK